MNTKRIQDSNLNLTYRNVSPNEIMLAGIYTQFLLVNRNLFGEDKHVYYESS